MPGPEEEPPADPRIAPAAERPDPATILNQIRKWGLHFEGKDPFAFLERIEELKRAYGYTDDWLLLGLPELLRGDPLLWYRNNREAWHTWAEFCQGFRLQYLPPGYRSQIKREIQGRRQQSGESFSRYATALLTLMRRAGGFTAQEQTEQLYENLDPEYQLYIRPAEATSVTELSARAAEYERIAQRRRERQPEAKRNHEHAVAAAAYSREDCCWRCSEISFVNPTTANLAQRQGIALQPVEKQVTLADGTPVPITHTITLPITAAGRTARHTFQILPNLDRPVLIGIDLWAKLRLTLPPPSAATVTTNPVVGEILEGITPRTAEEDQRLHQFLRQELAAFETIRGPTTRIEHRIRLKTDQPIKQRYRPRNPAMQAIINIEVDKMEQEGVIEPSRSAWSSPVVIVRKKDGTHRFCIDFRRLNSVTEKDAYPLPHIAATLNKLRGARYLSTLDLKNGYWQVPLAPDSRHVTAFTVTGKGLMQFRTMPFGLHSAPATFQRLLDSVLGPELEPNVLVYLDDIVVASQTFDDHLQHLAEIFRRLRDANLRLNAEKCHFCLDRLRYLGHIIDRQGIRTDPAKVSAIANWPVPTTLKQVRQFLGVASWYRRFIADFSTLAAPLTHLTRKNARWTWTTVEEGAFIRLKDALTSAPVLACPDFGQPFTLQTDASAYGLGAVLTQQLAEGEQVIAYASRTLNSAEKNYSATELECLAVVPGIRRMRDYLEGYRFTVITDHQSLRWLQRLESPSGRLGRWLFELQQFDFEIRYRKGSLNQVADALSRQPEICATKRTKACPWYRRITTGLRTRPVDFPDYQMRDGHLHQHILHDLDFREVPAEDQWKKCVPTDQRPALLQRLHNDPTAGHMGTAKTMTSIAQLYYWPGMFRDIARHVRACDICLAHKASQQRPAGNLHTAPVAAPWHQVSVDLVGPLPRSNHGHTWLLTMQDRFTKWLEVAPLRKATSVNVTRALTDRVIYRHGCPQWLISDNGTQLKSRQLEKLMTTFGIQHRTSPPYTPQCNPVERANRTLKTMLAQYHETTGHSPAYLNCGRELARPHPEDRRQPATALVPDVVHRHLQDAYELVRVHLARASQRQAKHYNLRRRDWRPRIGELVWKRNHTLSDKAKAFNAKLAPKFIGPMEVRKIVLPVIVDLRDARGRWHRHIHVQDLKAHTGE
ncbi:reverse ribonuclease integrase [Lasius niger]|uniref:RNA-directed DNA polymerase n=1 Tax=Lasius niger TaxID=67767 RepID=A0A0J7K9T8_LASNI|nr:reverse ribonuclease integrase [Lasius niger]